MLKLQYHPGGLHIFVVFIHKIKLQEIYHHSSCEALPVALNELGDGRWQVLVGAFHHIVVHHGSIFALTANTYCVNRQLRSFLQLVYDLLQSQTPRTLNDEGVILCVGIGKGRHSLLLLHHHHLIEFLESAGTDLHRRLSLEHHVRVAANIEVPIHQILNGLVVEDFEHLEHHETGHACSGGGNGRDDPTSNHLTFVPWCFRDVIICGPQVRGRRDEINVKIVVVILFEVSRFEPGGGGTPQLLQLRKQLRELALQLGIVLLLPPARILVLQIPHGALLVLGLWQCA
mmetsp:Transcript_36779/g.61471  ORF Transcript_36779/g.61471 Transcript_36779/m.61471 type:complete len:287 (+) Transcript_36779:542-1402(+)